MTEDKRPLPSPRKYPRLWQAYLYWEELMLMRQRHTLRLKAIDAGRSNLDGTYEREMMKGVFVVNRNGKKPKTITTFVMDEVLPHAEKILVEAGKEVPVWDWITGIRGLGAGNQAAKILAMIDDIGKFDTIAKLWRYAGYGLYPYYEEDDQIVSPTKGKRKNDKGGTTEYIPVPKEEWKTVVVRDRGVKGYVLPFNRDLKSAIYIAGDCMIKQQTPVYTDLYYAEKRRQRELNPVPIKENGVTKFNDGHIDNRARRRMAKQLLADLWVEWRVAEGLPVTERYR